MRKPERVDVFLWGVYVGALSKEGAQYVFRYDPLYEMSDAPSVIGDVKQPVHRSDKLFPFFADRLSVPFEGDLEVFRTVARTPANPFVFLHSPETTEEHDDDSWG